MAAFLKPPFVIFSLAHHARGFPLTRSGKTHACDKNSEPVKPGLQILRACVPSEAVAIFFFSRLPPFPDGDWRSQGPLSALSLPLGRQKSRPTPSSPQPRVAPAFGGRAQRGVLPTSRRQPCVPPLSLSQQGTSAPSGIPVPK